MPADSGSARHRCLHPAALWRAPRCPPLPPCPGVQAHQASVRQHAIQGLCRFCRRAAAGFTFIEAKRASLSEAVSATILAASREEFGTIRQCCVETRDVPLTERDSMLRYSLDSSYVRQWSAELLSRSPSASRGLAAPSERASLAMKQQWAYALPRIDPIADGVATMRAASD